ncbi:MAG: ATP-dependent helicase [Bdellovibrionota bacterium]
MKRFKLDEEVKRSILTYMARHHKIENLNSLPNWLSASAEEMINDTAALDAFQLLDKLTLSEAPSEKQKEESHDYASLMTIHASKGLEFPVVFLVGCEEGLLPHKNSVNELHGVNEERRLFYVALTRAKIRLHLTYSAFRQTGFQKESRIPSRFLKELPEELNQLESVESFRNNYLKQKEENKNKTVNKLAKIRQSLLSGEWN